MILAITDLNPRYILKHMIEMEENALLRRLNKIGPKNITCIEYDPTIRNFSGNSYNKIYFF